MGLIRWWWDLPLEFIGNFARWRPCGCSVKHGRRSRGNRKLVERALSPGCLDRLPVVNPAMLSLSRVPLGAVPCMSPPPRVCELVYFGLLVHVLLAHATTWHFLLLETPLQVFDGIYDGLSRCLIGRHQERSIKDHRMTT